MNAHELFFQTIQTGNVEYLRAQLLNNPHLVISEDARGFTPLIFATYFDKKDIAKVLLEHKANVDGRDATGNTALICVSFKGNLKLIEL